MEKRNRQREGHGRREGGGLRTLFNRLVVLPCILAGMCGLVFAVALHIDSRDPMSTCGAAVTLVLIVGLAWKLSARALGFSIDNEDERE